VLQGGFLNLLVAQFTTILTKMNDRVLMERLGSSRVLII